MTRNRLIYDSIVMILVNIFVRIIGFSYEVILSKFLGAEGIGLFQIATTTIMVFLSITSAGIPIVVTRLISEENSKKNYENIKRIYNTNMILNILISILIGGIIVLFSNVISIRIFKNKEMIYGVYLLIPAVIIISITNVLESYFYGIKNMATPGIAQIIESLTRLISVTVILYYFSIRNPIYGAIVAILGISIGEFFGFIWLSPKKNFGIERKDKEGFNRISISFLWKILYISLPLTLSGFLNIILRFINTIILPERLIASGYTSKTAMEVFGRVTGMAMPLVHLPFMVTSAVVINLITQLSSNKILKRFNDIRSDIQLAIKATLLISIPLAALFVMFSKTLGIFLYNDSQVGEYIRILGYGTIISGLQHTLSGILLGLGQNMAVTRNRVSSFILRIIILYFLVGNPNIHIYGFFIAFYFSNSLILILDIIALRKTINVKFNYFDIFGKPLIGSIFMIGYIYISTYDIEYLHNISPLNFIFTLSIGFLSYILILMITNALPKDIISKIIKNI